jgi:hypothetical protein
MTLRAPKGRIEDLKVKVFSSVPPALPVLLAGDPLVLALDREAETAADTIIAIKAAAGLVLAGKAGLIMDKAVRVKAKDLDRIMVRADKVGPDLAAADPAVPDKVKDLDRMVRADKEGPDLAAAGLAVPDREDLVSAADQEWLLQDRLL